MCTRPFRSRRGNTAIISAVSLTVLLGFAAIAVDLGYLRTCDGQLQAATDAAAFAGVAYLDGTPEGLVAAERAATSVAARHSVDGQAVTVTGDDIVFGVWKEGVGFVAASDPLLVNAMRVQRDLQGVTTFFAAAAFGGADVSAGASSTAALPPPQQASELDCYLPLALPDCQFDSGAAEVQDRVFRLSPAGSDNVGWARVGDSPNAESTKDQIETCSGPSAAIGDEVGLQNGVVQSALTAVEEAIESSDDLWDTTVYGVKPAQHTKSKVDPVSYSAGKVWEGPIMLFDGGASYCSPSASWTEFKAISGFAWATVYDVTGGSAEDKNIYVKIDTTRTFEVAGDGPGLGEGAGNVLAEPGPRLVQ